jgi:hypothetical protein
MEQAHAAGETDDQKDVGQTLEEWKKTGGSISMGSRVLGTCMLVTMAVVWILVSFGGSSQAVWDGIAMTLLSNLLIIAGILTYSSSHAEGATRQIDKNPIAE